MKEELRYIGQKIVRNKDLLAVNLVDFMKNNHTQSLLDSNMQLPERLEINAELIQYIGQALYEDNYLITNEVESWGEKAADILIQYQVSLSDSLIAMSSFRTVIWDVFTEELEQRKLAAITMLDVSKLVDPLLDKVNNKISEKYDEHNKKMMAIAYTALEQLSVPVVPIVDGVAVIPIIGEVDTHRAKLISETSLDEGNRLNLRTIIFDVSGVSMIDTMVAHQIFMIVESLRLIGIETILTGIRPEVAQTMVKFGLDFGGLKTFANLQQALKALGFGQLNTPN